MARGCLPWIAAAAAVATTAWPGAAHPADALVGRALFIGARPFAAGGPPCGACHAIGGASAPFAAALGPELSKSFDGMDAATVDGILQDLPFPTMTPLYAGRALTPAERDDLSAFLLQVAGRPAPGGAAVAGWAGLVVAVCLSVLALSQRRARGSSRAALLERARRVDWLGARRQPLAEAAPAAAVAASAAASRVQGGRR
jgi:hypothetical protein